MPRQKRAVGSSSMPLDQPRVQLADRVDGPATFEATINDDELDVLMWFAHDDDRYVCCKMTVEQRGGGLPITSGSIRRLAVESLLRQATGEALRPMLVVDGAYVDKSGALRFDGPAGTGVLNSFALPPEVKGHGPTREALEWVARIYRVAYAAGWEPRQQVAVSFEVAADTASDWIARTRKAGLLGPTTSGKVGV